MDDGRRMDLMDGRKARIGQHGRDGASPILRDQLGIVAAAVADIQAPHFAPGNPAAPAEEAVRDRSQHLRAEDIDLAHTQARMMMSSSAWFPTMNL